MIRRLVLTLQLKDGSPSQTCLDICPFGCTTTMLLRDSTRPSSTHYPPTCSTSAKCVVVVNVHTVLSTTWQSLYPPLLYSYYPCLYLVLYLFRRYKVTSYCDELLCEYKKPVNVFLSDNKEFLSFKRSRETLKKWKIKFV
uniref:Uncharacterized protein n=1 Tax=Cacopsylla melanoneura TaxID=428564 RepID=A0A8D8YBG8_9HEMI